MINKKKVIISVGGIIGIMIVICCLGFTSNGQNDVSLYEPILAKDNSDIVDDKISYEVFVEVKGAVKNPGVYKLNNDAIINDVINIAGGFKTTAYTKNINLSKKISSELVIYVFTKTEYNSKTNINVKCDCEEDNKDTILEPTIIETVTSSQDVCISNGYLIDNCIDNKISVIESSEESFPDTITKEDNIDCLVNINTAGIALLMTLPGIGESKANAIIDYRKTNTFNDISDLMNVSGISEKTFEKLKEYITV